MPTFVTTADLVRLRAETPDLVLVDVRLADDFAAAHLPGACNNAVFEVAFTGRMDKMVPDRSQPVCVTGHGRGSMEVAVAGEKLERAGYTAVHVDEDGLAGWREAGHPLETGEPLPEAPAWPSGRRELDLAESRAQWLGRNLLNSHGGALGIKRGHVICTPEGLDGGEIVFDMNDLGCDDLAGAPYHDVLIDHLKNDDFFDTEHFPEASYIITEGRFVKGAQMGSPNLEVRGVLSLKDVTAKLDAILAAGVGPDGVAGAQGTLAFDRTRWNVMYGSGRFFDGLAGHLVNDEIEVRLRLVLAAAD